MKKKIVLGVLVLLALVVAYFSGRLSLINNRSQKEYSDSREDEAVTQKQSAEMEVSSSMTSTEEVIDDVTPQESESSKAQIDEIEKEDGAREAGADGAEFDKSIISPYSGIPYEEVNDNRPFFLGSINVDSAFDTTAEEFVYYSELDDLGRCGQAYANVCSANLPTEPREEIGSIKPSGWQTIKYPDVIEDLYLYNRCHLIGYQLGGGSANERNLITGTRYMNVDGMLPFENRIKEYVTQTQNHVLYRVTPIFEGDNLLADGVLMEAYSVEDSGEGVSFCVYVYNVQPGIVIDYATGDSREMTPEELAQTNRSEGFGGELSEKSDLVSEPENDQSSETSVDRAVERTDETVSEGTGYNFDTYDNEEQQNITDKWVLNTKSHRIHKPTCDSVPKIAPQNYDTSNESVEELEAKGYKKCGQCFK